MWCIFESSYAASTTPRGLDQRSDISIRLKAFRRNDVFMPHVPAIDISLPMKLSLNITAKHGGRTHGGFGAGLLICVMGLCLVACTNPTVGVAPTVSPDPIHNSRNSLDWAGTYSGTLPCADCVGIALRLRLTEDGHYQLSTQYLGRQDEPVINDGRFTWTYDGNHIQLDAAADQAFYAVHEGALLRRYADGTWPHGDKAELMTLRRES